MMVQELIEKLGLQASDQVTGFEGTATSVSFDLYGCILILLTPTVDEDGKTRDGRWFDLNRINWHEERTMDAPSYENEAERITQGLKGGVETARPVK